MVQREKTPPIVVLDTNVVLDWAVFRDPSCAALSSAIEAGRLRWLGTARMRSELVHVLARGHLAKYESDPAAVLALWDRHCAVTAEPPTLPGRLRCSDSDDQVFIDLSVSVSAQWLVSRDRAVLKLCRRLSELGIVVVTPDRWRPDESPRA